jgi:hypothetical protein
MDREYIERDQKKKKQREELEKGTNQGTKGKPKEPGGRKQR